jgi:hypothetical protein
VGKEAKAVSDVSTLIILFACGLSLFVLGEVTGFCDGARYASGALTLTFGAPAGLETLIDLGAGSVGGRVANAAGKALGRAGAYLPNGKSK